MKTNLNLLLAGIMTAFCCSIVNAQIIYSNNFALGAAVDISNTPPTVANTYAGGSASALWYDIKGTSDGHAPLLQNGIDTCISGDSWVLPFTPETGHVYLLTCSVTLTNNSGNWFGPAGFCDTYTNYYSGDGRFVGNVAGWNWVALWPNNGNANFWAGPKAQGTALYPGDGHDTVVPGTNVVQILLDTRSALWTIAAYNNGLELGSSSYTYTANPTTIKAVGMTQQTPQTTPTCIQYNYFTLTTTLQPFIVGQPAPSQTLPANGAYTNSVAVMADTNGGSLFYQWYANGVPLANGGAISGANTNVLIINPISTANQLTNYYVIVTNNYGSSTSFLASLTVQTNPVVAAPASPSNSITLFAGTGSYVGSSPSFSVTAVGAPPLVYQWLTNGVVVGGATGASLSFSNLQLGGPTSFACIVSNSFGAVTNTWFATYSNAPTAAYPQAVLTDQPLDFWRLNESDDGSGNEGAICHDYQSGNNGVYTNVTLGESGYNTLEPTETSMYVTVGGPQPSCANRIANVDFAATMTNGVNAAFTVEAWANCIVANGISGGAPVVSQGTFGASSFFLGADTNSSIHNYQFYVRSANGTLYSADSTIEADDEVWHHLVGVCDEAHGKISLYIDGSLAASASIPANSGIFESSMPVAIGAGIRSGASDYNVPFTGNIDDVAIYKDALSVGQVIAHYGAAGGSVPVSFVSPLPPTNVAYLANQTVTIPATVSGSPSLGYYWTNLTAGGVLGSSATSTNGSLDATLTIPNAPASLSGDQLELVVTNSISSTNWLVTLFNPPAPITLDYSSPILYSNLFNGGEWAIAGMSPTVANVLVGGTNSVWINSLGTNDNGVVQANGTPTSTKQNSWVLPFTPHAGYIYTISATVTFSGNPNNWIALGFFQNILTNGTLGNINNANGALGVDWMLVQQNGGVQYFPGPNTAGGNIANGTTGTAGNVTHNIQIVLDATGAQWTCHAVIDGNTTGTGTYGSNPTIRGVGIAQNGNASFVPSFIKWNTIMLTQVAPGGVPPYLLDPQPPTSILLTNGTVTVPATAFGSAPFGYYWSNNSSVIASGLTNNMAPLPASLSVSSSSLSAGQLELVVTNVYGTNTTLITLAPPINPNPTNIVFSVTGNQMTLNWPVDHTGWTLQAQTNALSIGISTNWVDVAGSTSTNELVIPINLTNGSVFYRLILP
ncbi:MAG: LamG domain-containing protein [Limisphaerales bacterium]